MTAVELVQRARDLGLQLERRGGGGLAVRPASKLPPDLAEDLRRHKSEILRLLSPGRGWQSLPPLDMPLVALKRVPTPVHREMVIAYQSRQCANRRHREWLTRRKAAYLVTMAKTWDTRLLAYAAARDAACWQLNRTEAEVWELLDGIESCVQALKSESARNHVDPRPRRRKITARIPSGRPLT
jgi:hypothetical protein